MTEAIEKTDDEEYYDVYNKSVNMLEDDEISIAEAGFMEGWNNSLTEEDEKDEEDEVNQETDEE